MLIVRFMCCVTHIQNTSVDPGPSFPDYSSKQLGFHEPIVFDRAPSGSTFGGVKTDVKSTYAVVNCSGQLIRKVLIHNTSSAFCLFFLVINSFFITEQHGGS